MPKELERKLRLEAERKGLKGEKKRAYIFGGLRRSGWKPKKRNRRKRI